MQTNPYVETNEENLNVTNDIIKSDNILTSGIKKAIFKNDYKSAFSKRDDNETFDDPFYNHDDL